ncbi:MAG: hypothetical protein CMH57_04525 [Myxococcales bacterium]|nr:hypothetical protein [Myxococcales bacterium]
MRTYTPARTLLIAALTALALAAVGCKADNPAFDPDPEGGSGGSGGSGDLTTAACPGGGDPITQEFTSLADPAQLDVLVVVSNAPGSSDLQARLSEAMPALVQQLTSAGVDYQLGVVTGDTESSATAGSIRSGGVGQVNGCDEAPRIITAADGQQAAAYAACNALQGQGGPELQRFFDAVEQALTVRATDTDELTGNAGFLRPQARLLVLFASDRDDCSNLDPIDTAGAPNPQTACEWSAIDLRDTADFAQTLVGLKKDLGSTSVAVLGGADDGVDVLAPEAVAFVCTDAAMNPVYPTTRLLELADAISPNARFESACAASYLGAMVRFSELLGDQSAARLCLDDAAAGPVRAVTRVAADDSEADIPQGEDGYLYLGATADCATGAVQIAGSQLSGGADDRNVSVTYCPAE